VSSMGDIGRISIGGNLVGGSITGTQGNLVESGVLSSINGRIGSVVIGGSVLAGRDESTGGALIDSASIRAALDIGSIVVKGSVVGTIGSGGDRTPVTFAAKGQAAPTETVDLAIGKVFIGGHATRLNVLAGFDFGTILNPNPANGNAQIGTVSIGGDWVASNVVAGVENFGANATDDDGFVDDEINFGDANDHIINGLASSIAKIGSIIIKGVVAGTMAGGDHFGFVSHAIGSLKISGTTVPIADALLAPLTGDVRLHLV
jgi:hypothetical protein